MYGISLYFENGENVWKHFREKLLNGFLRKLTEEWNCSESWHEFLNKIASYFETKDETDI